MSEKPIGMTVTEAMLHIKAIDRDASLILSEFTGQWLVSVRIEISDGVCLTSTCEHREWPNDAVMAYFNALRAVDVHHFAHVIVKASPERKHYRWNGAAFAAEAVDLFVGVRQ